MALRRQCSRSPALAVAPASWQVPHPQTSTVRFPILQLAGLKLGTGCCAAARLQLSAAQARAVPACSISPPDGKVHQERIPWPQRDATVVLGSPGAVQTRKYCPPGRARELAEVRRSADVKGTDCLVRACKPERLRLCRCTFTFCRPPTARCRLPAVCFAAASWERLA